MQKFVFGTGVYNILLGLSFLVPGLPSFLSINVPASNLWVYAIASFVICLGVLLILCSKNLQTRGSLVYWEGVFRILFFLLLAYFGFLGNVGVMVGVIGIIDLLIGLGYLLGLPKALHTSHMDLLLDR